LARFRKRGSNCERKKIFRFRKRANSKKKKREGVLLELEGMITATRKGPAIICPIQEKGKNLPGEQRFFALVLQISAAGEKEGKT